MIHSGKCPKCEKAMSHINIQAVELKIPFSRDEYKGVSYQCPWCSTILSAGPDFKAMITEIVAKVKSR